MKITDFLIQCECSIKEAMQQINKNAKGIVYVVKNEELVGVITDGDVRRFLINGGDLDEKVSLIMNRKPIVLDLEHEKKVHVLMKRKEIRSLPILNEDNKIVKLYFDDYKVEVEKEELSVPVVIMAGGKGTRLYPYTQILPKPLIPIGDKTITEHIMDRFIEYGCNQFTMIVNYKKHFIKSYFDDCESKVKVNFVSEPQFLGTAGGLRLLDKSIDSTFFMTNCDILIEEDYSKILNYHKENKNIITMVCAVKNMTIPYGTVEISEEGKILGLKEKPQLSFITNTGFYVLEPEFVQMIPKNTFIHITDVIQQCIEQGYNVGVYKINEEKWLDMGQMDELERMKEKLNVR